VGHYAMTVSTFKTFFSSGRYFDVASKLYRLLFLQYHNRLLNLPVYYDKPLKIANLLDYTVLFYLKTYTPISGNHGCNYNLGVNVIFISSHLARFSTVYKNIIEP